MGVTDVGNLALLGLVAERPRPADELVGAVKLVGGDRFTPTAAFIEGRVAHLVETGCLERRHDADHPGATRSGKAHLAWLLCLEVDPGAAGLWSFRAAGRRTAPRERAGDGAVDRLLCTVMERCLALEQAREALELRWMQDAMAAAAMGERIDEK
jgi:hypothetical protein